MADFTLIDTAGAVSTAAVNQAPDYQKPRAALRARTAFAASHVIPHAWADNTPGRPAEIDWDATLAFRHHVWSWGLGVADAMDTAQRNMGLDAAATRELITRSSAEARSVGGTLVVGVSTDHVDDTVLTLDQIVDAYTEQLQHAEDAGAGVVLMCSRHLARAATSAADYESVYARVLAAASTPVVLHWLGEAFDPQLAGYFGASDWQTAADTVLRIIEASDGRVNGVKMSLLNAESEISVRRRLPAGTTMYTGDDFNYVDLIAGDSEGHSDALLGAFAAVAPSASAAIQALDAGDEALYRSILAPTEALSRQIFATPTFYYKTGVAFLSWLNGHQSAFSMVGGLHSARSLPHLSEIVRLANDSGALERPELAAARWNGLLAQNGVTA
ncbi:dihydrodipicolinate synthase family protein [Microbacterium sp. MPKO10]|uniref:dihydrodipicolinate synthase family protein n=1 Tax=Microbacterium sp. MPKO10 TaxID=2989818 RepID=UPI0022364D0A|nr:dihydrodipicolinate synthase family protein [Microbacterium sp. MPKO10]MCW4456653.1 dihydrodipicolinate synthase family protein [Microbacterium sp. MPKO10]